jgi:hypothetical protein
MIKAESIPLEVWQDPQSDLILIFSLSECSVYFLCWESRGMLADYLGHLSFQGASLVRSFCRESSPYQAVERHRSNVLRVRDSDLARDCVEYQKSHYPHMPLETKSLKPLFVVTGHDIYHEILADSFTVTKIPCNHVTDPRLLNLIANA